MTNDVQVPKPIFLVVLVGEPQKHYQKLRQTKCVQQMQKRSQLANVARDLQCGAKRGGEVHWTPQLLSMVISVQRLRSSQWNKIVPRAANVSSRTIFSPTAQKSDYSAFGFGIPCSVVNQIAVKHTGNQFSLSLLITIRPLSDLDENHLKKVYKC